MFVVVTALAVTLGWLAWNVKQVRERTAILPSLQHQTITMTSEVVFPKRLPSDPPTGKLPWLWSQFGAQPEKRLYTRQGELSNAEIARVRRLFPETEIWEYPRGTPIDTDQISTLRAIRARER
jgi:hypothetical protein